eukprot:gene4938-6910_t
MGNLDSKVIDDLNDEIDETKEPFIIHFIRATDIPSHDSSKPNAKVNPFIKAFIQSYEECISKTENNEERQMYRQVKITSVMATHKRYDCNSVVWNSYRDFNITPPLPTDATLTVEIYHVESKAGKDEEVMLGYANIPILQNLSDELPKNYNFIHKCGSSAKNPDFSITLSRVFINEPPPRQKTFFLIRHGESKWNQAQSKIDIGGMLDRDHALTEEGCQQAIVLNKKWKLKQLTRSDEMETAMSELDGHIMTFATNVEKNFDTADLLGLDEEDNQNVDSGDTNNIAKDSVQQLPIPPSSIITPTIPNKPLLIDFDILFPRSRKLNLERSQTEPVQIETAQHNNTFITNNETIPTAKTTDILDFLNDNNSNSVTRCSENNDKIEGVLYKDDGGRRRLSSEPWQGISNESREESMGGSLANNHRRRESLRLREELKTLGALIEHQHRQSLSLSLKKSSFENNDILLDSLNITDTIDQTNETEQIDTNVILSSSNDNNDDLFIASTVTHSGDGNSYSGELASLEQLLQSQREKYIDLFMQADKVYSSPLTRAIQTAFLSMDGHEAIRNPSLILYSNIREIKRIGGLDTVGIEYGETNILNRTENELSQSIGHIRALEVMAPSLDVNDADQPWWTPIASYESDREQQDRIKEFLTFIRYCDAKNPVFVGHSLFFKAFYSKRISDLMKRNRPELSENLRRFRLSNATVLAVTVLFSDRESHDATILDGDLIFGGGFHGHSNHNEDGDGNNHNLGMISGGLFGNPLDFMLPQPDLQQPHINYDDDIFDPNNNNNSSLTGNILKQSQQHLMNIAKTALPEMEKGKNAITKGVKLLSESLFK